MTRQKYVDRLQKAMICDCDRYGHPHSPEPFRIRIKRKCVSGVYTDRFGHACCSKVAIAGESGGAT